MVSTNVIFTKKIGKYLVHRCINDYKIHDEKNKYVLANTLELRYAFEYNNEQIIEKAIEKFNLSKNMNRIEKRKNKREMKKYFKNNKIQYKQVMEAIKNNSETNIEETINV
jgi:phosphoribosylaminoimidazole carboxylase (NCAIR synthetase)